MKVTHHKFSGFLLMVLTLVACTEAVGIEDTFTAMQDNPPVWLTDLGNCPADYFPEKETPLEYSHEDCIADTGRCLKLCDGGASNACYQLAVEIQSFNDDVLSEQLYARSCRLGVISGCTNRAAAMLEENLNCSFRTFEKTCDFNDPWGCTMLGILLSAGRGVETDFARATQALKKACALDEESDACEGARSIEFTGKRLVK